MQFCVITRANLLTWHEGLIPEDEVWIKIGGDKGGGSFKMSFQVANVQCVNSPKNTYVFCCFEANDSVMNLHIALDRYRDQLHEMSSNKKMEVCTDI